MSRMTALVALSLMLVAGAATAQQTMQPGQQSGMQQGSQQGALPPWNSPQMVQKISTAVNQSNADLEKAIDTATSQAKGKAVGAAFSFHQGTGAAAGQSTAGQGQNLVAHVYVVADNQLKDVIVDAKSNNVLSTETRQMVSNPWSYREGMGAGGSSGSSMDGSQSGAQGQGSAQGQTSPRERAGMPSSVSMLRLETAQRIVKLADQDNITLQKAISTAEGQAQGAKVVGVFLVLPHQANVGAGAGTSDGMSSSDTTGQPSQAGQQNVYSKVFAVTSDQVKVMTIDAKNDKVINTETRSTFIGPWEGRMGAAGGQGGTSGQGGSGTGGSTGQPGSTGGSKSSGSGEQFPTGSGQGTGPGSLGG